MWQKKYNNIQKKTEFIIFEPFQFYRLEQLWKFLRIKWNFFKIAIKFEN